MASPPIPLHNRRMGTAWAPSPGSGATYTPRPFAHPRMSISASAATGGTPTFTLHSSPPPSAQQQQDQHHSSSPSASNVAPFRPSIAIVVGVLTTMFSITFLLLLYAKHCKRGSGARNGASGGGFSNSNLNGGAAPPRNSGIDRCVVESLPLFRFGVLLGQKAESSGGGLECAVCLNRFDPAELLRLLPKCKHAFHVECVDTWLDAHSTCPLCRCRVDPEDAFLIPAADPKLVPQPQAPPENDLRVSGSSRDGGDGDGDGSGEDGTLQRQQWDGERDGKPLCGSTGAEQLPEARGSPTGAADSVSSTNNYSGCAPFNILTGRASFSLSTLTGRHSSAGEKSSGAALLQVVVERPGRRKSIDDAILSNAAATARGPEPEQPLRRKDGLLLTTTDQLAGIPPSTKSVRNQEEVQRRFGHRILISSGNEGVPSPAGVSMQERRWSDLKPSDLLVLRREMILSAADSARYSASARARVSASSSTISSPSTAINGRCASEISGMSRLAAANRPVAIQEERERALRKKWQGFSAWRTGLWPTARGGGAGGGGNGPSR